MKTTPREVQATIALIVLRLALSPDGLKTQDLYDDKNRVFRAIHYALYHLNFGIDWLPYDPKTGQAMVKSEVTREKYLTAERRWLPEPPPTDEEYRNARGDIHAYITDTTDALRGDGLITFEGVTPSEQGNQYTIRLTKKGRKLMDKMIDYRPYEEALKL